MGDVIINVEGVSKKYMLSHQESNGDGLRHKIEHLTRAPLKWFQSNLQNNGGASGNGHTATRQSSREEFWALKDVSFQIKQGDVVGIIGRNGAGKSTLLKILSRIVEPTRGRIVIDGRVASLLEVGTGFHPELTGRENIFLNGAILGMSRTEIRGKLDEIVAFAEIEKFLDTPVKRYSSGMYVRLAFAVAAHLEPEILVVDEVLAVGDSEFQKKCLGRMERVASRNGRTILFVSHNLDALKRICQKGLLLVNGQIECFDTLDVALSRYLRVNNSAPALNGSSDKKTGIRGVRVSRSDLSQGRLKVEIEFSSPYPVGKPTFGLVVYTMLGTPVFGTNTLFDPFDTASRPTSAGTATVLIDPLPLWSGEYRIAVWLSDVMDPLDYCPDAGTFDFLSPATPPHVPPTQTIGAVRVRATWVFANVAAVTS